MTVEYQNLEKDYLDFIRLQQKNRLSKYLFPMAVGGLITGMSFQGESPSLLRLVVFSLLSFCVLCGIIYYIPVLLASQKLKERIHAQPSFLERKKIQVQTDGLFFESDNRQILLKWKEIVQVQSVGRYLYLLLSSNAYILIPANGFMTESDFVSFQASIQRGLVWGTIDPVQRWVEVQPKPPYLMGLLCLIPLIGAFFGLSFIISGISKYKDRLFTLIGVFGILYTIAIYTALYQYGKRQHFNQPQSIELSPSETDGDVTMQDSLLRN